MKNEIMLKVIEDGQWKDSNVIKVWADGEIIDHFSNDVPRGFVISCKDFLRYRRSNKKKRDYFGNIIRAWDDEPYRVKWIKVKIVGTNEFVEVAPARCGLHCVCGMVWRKIENKKQAQKK